MWLKKWSITQSLQHHEIELQFIQPGKPAQNGYIERFNRTYREAILEMYLFDSIQHVQLLTNQWLQHYNLERPHDSLQHLTPFDYAKQHFLQF